MKQQDFSKVHHLITELFPKPTTVTEWESYKLSDEQVQFYHENGYLANVKMFDDKVIEVLREELGRIKNMNTSERELFYEFHSNESTSADHVLLHALGAWRVSPAFHDILWNPAFVMAASQLLGGPIRFWHDQLFSKPAKHGGVVAWHQDYSYWTRTTPMQHLTCWTGLDDATTENGCLQYVPQSHKWGLLDKPELAGDMEGINEYLTEEQKAKFKPIPIELKKGYATFHHPLMVHGSYENHSDRPRRAVVLNVFRDGTISHSDEPLLQGVPISPKGKKVEGQFFPFLSSIQN